MHKERSHTQETPVSSTLASVGLRLSDWFERWFPDAFALALAAVAIVFVASAGHGSSPSQTAQWFGAGFWDLVAFTMQMSMIIVTGYAVATSPPVYAVIRETGGGSEQRPRARRPSSACSRCWRRSCRGASA